MTLHFNRQNEKGRRRYLRKNMTAAEKIAWDYLRKKQTNFRFLRQYSVDRFIIDFYCPKLKLAIEVDGSIHELQKNIENDRTREKYLAGYGINFIRTKNDEWIGNPELVKKRIEEAIKLIESS